MDSNGTAYGPYRKMATTFDSINLKTINFEQEKPPLPPFNDVRGSAPTSLQDTNINLHFLNGYDHFIHICLHQLTKYFREKNLRQCVFFSFIFFLIGYCLAISKFLFLL